MKSLQHVFAVGFKGLGDQNHLVHLNYLINHSINSRFSAPCSVQSVPLNVQYLLVYIYFSTTLTITWGAARVEKMVESKL